MRVVLVGCVVLLPGCATLVNGTNQTVTVSTTPPGASCTLDRMGERVGAIGSTPGSLRIDKSKHDLSVTCSKEGYQTASTTQSASFNGATFGNLIAGGIIGIVVDASSGANFSYPPDIRMDLPPLAARSAPIAGVQSPAPAETVPPPRGAGA